MTTYQIVIFAFLSLFLAINAEEGTSIGAIVDENSRIGKEQRVAMEMAVDDFLRERNQSLVLHVKNSSGWEPLQATLAAMELINTSKVEAIIGPLKWEDMSMVAEKATENQVPILSFSDATPRWAEQRYPFLLQATGDKSKQMKAIAAILQSWNWHRVAVLYEDVDSSLSGLIPNLYYALREVNAEIDRVVPLSPFSSSNASSLSDELKRLQTEDCRVFVVHSSLRLASALFERAKELNMMEKDYVWITTDPVTSLVHSIDSATIPTMKGVLGVRSYFPDTGQAFQDLKQSFRAKFSTRYPEEENNEPGIFAIQAYDAVSTVALAADQTKTNKTGLNLLNKILKTEFQGLSGKFQFINSRQNPPVSTFQIINVVSKGYNELGFWSDGFGFHATIGSNATYNNISMIDLEQVVWPGGPHYTPRGWVVGTKTNPLHVGVPALSGHKEFANVYYDEFTRNWSFSGFAIEVFKATVRELPFALEYEFAPYHGINYTEFVRQISLKEFDAVVGDVSVVSNRYEYAEYAHPFTETGLVMVVPIKLRKVNKAALFLKPFTTLMWVAIIFITLYNGVIVSCMERNLENSEFSSWFPWSAFTTLFSLQAGHLLSNLSKMAMVVWLFVSLVITQTYTANLASLLTIQRLEPTITSMEELQRTNATVGYCTGSFIKSYMEVLRFKEGNLKNYSTIDEYAYALENKVIAAAFMEVVLAKLFLTKYCKGYMTVGPTFNIGGYGFAFARGSPLIPSINQALLNISERGLLLDLEKAMLRSPNLTCMDTKPSLPELEDAENQSIGADSFWILFAITGGTTTIAFMFYASRVGISSVFDVSRIWSLMGAVVKPWSHDWKQRFRRRVAGVREIPALVEGPPAALPDLVAADVV